MFLKVKLSKVVLENSIFFGKKLKGNQLVCQKKDKNNVRKQKDIGCETTFYYLVEDK